jgi:fatty acid-binding protein DegV
VAAVRSAREQVAFALKRLERDLAGHPRPLILLQYSDNEDWLRQTVAPGLQARFPQAELVLQPLSLTTGVHTGPGSWAVALHPEPEKRARSERAAP